MADKATDKGEIGKRFMPFQVNLMVSPHRLPVEGFVY